MSGVIRVMGSPVSGVDVLHVDGTKVIGATQSDADGHFATVAGATTVVARFVSPFLGVVVRADVADDVEIAVDRSQIVRLAGAIRVPAGTPFDWVDVKLTPRVDVPPRVVLHDGDGIREAYWIRRLVQPTFDVRVLRGVWEVRASREIDGPLSVQQGQLGLGAVTFGDQSPAPKFMGFEIAVDREAELVLQLSPA